MQRIRCRPLPGLFVIRSRPRRDSVGTENSSEKRRLCTVGGAALACVPNFGCLHEKGGLFGAIVSSFETSKMFVDFILGRVSRCAIGSIPGRAYKPICLARLVAISVYMHGCCERGSREAT